jgi:CheY-like chemotaxis protein
MGERRAASRVLIVEDEFVIALDLSYQLEEAGYEVCGPASKTAAALELIEKDAPDLALLDVNLGKGETSWDIARVLTTRQIPFAFLTGYPGTVLPADLVDAPILAKPCQFNLVQEAIGKLVKA